MSSLLSSLVDILSEGLHNDKCTDCKSCFEYIKIEENLLIFNGPKCNKKYKKHFNKYLIKRFANTYEFCDRDINKFMLLLRKGIYPYEYIDSWKRLNEILLPDKVELYSDLGMEKLQILIIKMLKRYGIDSK